MKKYLTYFLLIIIGKQYAQTNRIDSLKQALIVAPDDSLRCVLLSQLSDILPEPERLPYLYKLRQHSLIGYKNDFDNIAFYAKKFSNALSDIGLIAKKKGEVYVALNNYLLSLKIRLILQDKMLIAVSYNNLGMLYKNMGDIDRALESLVKSLELREELKDTVEIAKSLNNLAIVHQLQGDYEKAITLNNQALKFNRQLNNSQGVALALNNLGVIHMFKNQHEEAFNFLNEALEILTRSNNKAGSALQLNNIGFLLKKQRHFDEAIRYFMQSLELYKQNEDKAGEIVSLSNIGFCYVGLKNIPQALEMGQAAYTLSCELGFPERIGNAAELLSDAYKLSGDYRSAFKYFQLRIQMQDSVSNENTRKAGVKSQLKYEYEKKATADSVKTAEEKRVINAQLKQEKTQRFVLYGGLSLVGIFAMFMVNRFRVTNRQKKLIEEQKKTVEAQKHLVEEKQKEILDSIKYARRIQSALITGEYYVQKNLNRLRNG